MSTDFRNSVDVMTTETTCLSSIWQTDEETRSYLRVHGREQDYCSLSASDMAYYDGCIEVNLSAIKPMIALPFHPANVYEIDTLKENLPDILHEVEMESEKFRLGAQNSPCWIKSKRVSSGSSRELLPVVPAEITST